MSKKKHHKKTKNTIKPINPSPRSTTITITEDEIAALINDTSEIVAQDNATRLSSIGPAVRESGILTNSVEFWSWMNRNYSKCGHFASAESMRDYLSSGSVGQKEFVKKVVQGKGYEWDWMAAQRRSFDNLFKTFDAGDVANRPGSDVTVHDILTGTDSEAQLKAYTSSNKPHLKNTPKDMTVVTNAEKVNAVREMGYDDVISFGDKESITKARDARIDAMRSGKASPEYTVKNVGSTIAKAGMMGFVIGITTETIISYKKWKRGEISTLDYLKEILKSGSSTAIITSSVSGIMIPVSKMVTTAGMSSLVTIPIAFILSASVDKVIAPAFARGDYKKMLVNAKYYHSLSMLCGSLAIQMECSSKEYANFIDQMIVQQQEFDRLAQKTLSPQALEDFEYFSKLPPSEAGIVISGMIALLEDSDAKFESIAKQNWAQRMFKTITGKNKATKEDIRANYEKLPVYMSKAIEILLERQCVDEKLIQVLGSQIIEVFKQNIALVSRVETLEHRFDNLSDSLVKVNTPSSLMRVTSLKALSDENAQQTFIEAEKLYLKGKLIDAFPLFQQAADNGVGRAYYYLGLYFSEGYAHITPDRSSTLENWRKGMGLGDPLSTYAYGFLKHDNNDSLCKKWMRDHLHCILRCEQNGDAEAAIEYGWYLIMINPESEDAIVDAIGFFKKAADAGNWRGAYLFYQITEDIRQSGVELPNYSFLFENVEWFVAQMMQGVAKLMYPPQDYNASARHFQKSLWLQETVVEAAAYLAFLLGTGLVDESLSDGISIGSMPMYYNAGLTSQNAVTLFQIGHLYFYGITEKENGKNAHKAYAYLERSFSIHKQGFIAGMLGYLSLTEEGTQKNKAKAIDYLETGCQMGDYGSFMLLSECYKNGWGVAKDVIKAKELEEKAKRTNILSSAMLTQMLLKSMIE